MTGLCSTVIGEHICNRTVHIGQTYHHCECGGRWLETPSGEVIDWIEP